MFSSFDTFPDDDVAAAENCLNKKPSSSSSSRPHRSKEDRTSSRKDLPTSKPSSSNRSSSASRESKDVRTSSKPAANMDLEDTSLLRDYYIDRKGDVGIREFGRVDRKLIPRYRPMRVTPLGVKKRAFRHSHTLVPSLSQISVDPLAMFSLTRPPVDANVQDFIALPTESTIDTNHVDTPIVVADTEILKTQQSLHQTVGATPLDTESWIKLIKLQIGLYLAGHFGKSAGGMLEKQQAICDRALKHLPQSEQLLVYRLALSMNADFHGLGQDIWSMQSRKEFVEDRSTEIMVWTEILSRHPLYTSLAMKLDTFHLCDKEFDYHQHRDLVLKHFPKQQNSRNYMWSWLRLLALDVQCGYHERAYAQVLVTAFRIQSKISLKTLEDMWDNSLEPFFGDHTPQSRRVHDLDECSEWAAEESSAAEISTPIRPCLSKDDDQPESIVLFDDIGPYLYREDLKDPYALSMFWMVFTGLTTKTWCWFGQWSTSDDILVDPVVHALIHPRISTHVHMRTPMLFELWCYGLAEIPLPSESSPDPLHERAMLTFLLQSSEIRPFLLPYYIVFEVVNRSSDAAIETLTKLGAMSGKFLPGYHMALLYVKLGKFSQAGAMFNQLARSARNEAQRYQIWNRLIELDLVKNDAVAAETVICHLLGCLSLSEVGALLTQKLAAALSNKSGPLLVHEICTLCLYNSFFLRIPIDDLVKVASHSPFEEHIQVTLCKIFVVWSLKFPSRPHGYSVRTLMPFLESKILQFPHNTFILSLYIQNEQSAKVESRAAFFFYRVLGGDSSLEIRIFRHCMDAKNSGSLIFEHSLLLPECPVSPLLWLQQMENLKKCDETTKLAIAYRAIDACPWHAGVHLSAMIICQDNVHTCNDIYQSMITKGLRVYNERKINRIF